MIAIPAEQAERIRAELAASPDAMVLELARRHRVPEQAILELLGPPRAVRLDAGRWEALLHELPALGSVRVIVSNRGVTMETRGRFGGFSRTGDWVNVQTDSLDLHLFAPAIGGAMALEKPSHLSGRPTASLQLFDHDGAPVLKVFLLFGEGDERWGERRAAFADLRARYAQAD